MKVGVLGGGPGGAVAALKLAGGGADVTIHVPSVRAEKPCGGALPTYLPAEVPELDLGGLPAVAIERAVLENAAGSRLEIPLDGIEIYRRQDFDRALLEAALGAGARLREGRVRSLEAGQGGVCLDGGTDRERRYDWLVAADGARGLSRRWLGLEPRGESVGLGATLAAGAGSELVVAFPDVGDAYLWIFPRPGGVSVGAAYTPSRLSDGAARVCLDAFLERHLPFPAAAARGARYRYPIPVFNGQTVPDLRLAVSRRLLLVGDAAALADPLTREGIRQAVRSGSWAAASLLRGRPEDYPERVAGDLAAEMRRAARASRLFFDDRVGQWMLPVSRTLPGVRRVLADLLGCRQPYLGLRRRLLRAAVNPRTGSRSVPAPGSPGSWSAP